MNLKLGIIKRLICLAIDHAVILHRRVLGLLHCPVTFFVFYPLLRYFVSSLLNWWLNNFCLSRGLQYLSWWGEEKKKTTKEEEQKVHNLT